MKSRMRALPSFSYRGTTSTRTRRWHAVRPGFMRRQDSGQPAHAGADQHHRPADLLEHRPGVGAQRLHRVVRVGGAVAVAVAAAVERDDVQAAVGQDLPGVLPGEAVLAAAVQHQHRQPGTGRSPRRTAQWSLSTVAATATTAPPTRSTRWRRCAPTPGRCSSRSGGRCGSHRRQHGRADRHPGGR